MTTVSLPQLIQLLTELSGTDATVTHKFIHEFFAIIQECLIQRQQVKIKGIGTFAVENPESGEVCFSPDPELAAAVNAPFAMFSPVELSDGISAEDLEPESDIATDRGSDTSGYVVTIDDPCPEPEPAPVPEPEPETNPCPEPEPGPELPEEEPQPELSEEEPARVVTEEETEEEGNDERRSIKGYLTTAAVALAIGFAAGYLTHRTILPEVAEQTAVTEPIQVADTVTLTTADSIVAEIPVPAAIQPEKPVETVRDTISRNHFLASMARQHYGHMEYWVYIYEANPGLGHPDRIKPGTVVTIPPQSEFALKSDSATMARAMRLYAEIYGRYKQ